MSSTRQENVLGIIEEASQPAIAEAIATPAGDNAQEVEQSLPQTEVSIPQAEFSRVLSEGEDTKEELNREKLKTRQLEQRIAQDDDIHGLRKEYVPKLYVMIVGWLFAVASFVFLTGFSSDFINNPDCQLNCVRFKLSDNVLIAFITTTTATVIGLFVIVAKWLFPSPEKEEKKEK